MIQTNEGLNTSRMIANNGQIFIEDTNTHAITTYGNNLGWFGFQPHKDGCVVAEITIANGDGDTITQTDTAVATWIGTTADLDSFMGAPLVKQKKGYITSIKLTSGACTLYFDTISKL